MNLFNIGLMKSANGKDTIAFGIQKLATIAKSIAHKTESDEIEVIDQPNEPSKWLPTIWKPTKSQLITVGAVILTVTILIVVLKRLSKLTI
ncbi:MAG: hypothetical protein P9X24_13985 [Candidatus Hatepunaea meridiana]|nr:hypothetical protein [Candidatus Hatepunaea meridiana]